MKNAKGSNHNRHFFSFFLFLILTATIYSNTLESSWHFDDFPNILQNSRIHITKINKDTIYKSFFAPPVSGNNLFRPVSSLSFAINWYFGKDHVTGYHLVNILIHILSAFILFLIILNLFRSPILEGKFEESRHFIALLASIFWAINPIQTQAVTYIVQRMTILAAMFYILGMWFYIKARINESYYHKSLLFFGCFVSYICALGSKENAVLLPITLLLLEICFFQRNNEYTRKRPVKYLLAGACLCVLLGCLIYAWAGNFLFFLNGYEWRPFTLTERLMTQPRVVVFYLSQIFYPVPYRLSFAHDVLVSTSLFNPWTTLPAILCIIFLICFGVFQLKKRPIIAFSILFFFLNHSVESSVLPLEFVFEHRNYLPSMFLFFPVAFYLKQLMDYYRNNNYFIYLSLASFISFLIILIGIGTHTRNMVWASEVSLSSDTIKKAPRDARAVQGIADYYKKRKLYNNALFLYEKSLSLNSARPEQSNALAYNNMGNIYTDVHEYEKAIFYYEKSLSIFPISQRARLNMVKALIRLGKWEDALTNVDQLLSGSYFVEESLHLKGLILFRKKNIKGAFECFRRAFKLNPNNPEIIVKLGMVLSLMGHYNQAEFFLNQAKSQHMNNTLILLYFIDNYIRAGNKELADRYIDDFLDNIGDKNIIRFFENQMRDSFSLPLTYQLIFPAIEKRLQTKAVELINISSALKKNELPD